MQPLFELKLSHVIVLNPFLLNEIILDCLYYYEFKYFSLLLHIFREFRSLFDHVIDSTHI
jgi:hypothetical protein